MKKNIYNKKIRKLKIKELVRKHSFFTCSKRGFYFTTEATANFIKIVEFKGVHSQFNKYAYIDVLSFVQKDIYHKKYRKLVWDNLDLFINE